MLSSCQMSCEQRPDRQCIAASLAMPMLRRLVILHKTGFCVILSGVTVCQAELKLGLLYIAAGHWSHFEGIWAVLDQIWHRGV